MSTAKSVGRFSVNGKDRFTQLEVLRMTAEGKAKPLSNEQFFKSFVLVESVLREHIRSLPSATSTIGITEGFFEKRTDRRPFGEKVVCRFEQENVSVVFPVPQKYKGKFGLLMFEGLGQNGKPTFELKAAGSDLVVAVKDTGIQLLTNISREWRLVNDKGMPIGDKSTEKSDPARIGVLKIESLSNGYGRLPYVGPIIRGFFHGAEDQGYDCRAVDVVLDEHGRARYSVLQLESDSVKGYMAEAGIQVLEGGNLIVGSAGWKASGETSATFNAALEKAKETLARNPENASEIRAILIDVAAVGINSHHIKMLNELQ